MAEPIEGLIRGRGAGEVLTYPRGGHIEVKVAAAETGGAFALLEFNVPPGGTGSPLHYHLETQETFYLLEGELTLTMGERTERVVAGSLAHIPPRVAHRFVNDGPGVARLLIVLAPGSFEAYFRDLAELPTGPDGRPDETLVREVAAKHRQVYVDAPASDSAAAASPPEG
jgi:quercetin dioxygenase-like cupin family protein